MSDPTGRPFEPPGADPFEPAGADPFEPPGADRGADDPYAPPASAAPEGVPAPPPPAQPADVNLEAIDRAGLSPEFSSWLREVALQVDSRLDRIAPGWREASQAPAARACAFGLLLGQLAAAYPHVRDQLSRTAEAHPSFGTLQAGSRLETLRQIAADPPRMGAWLGPLVRADADAVQRLLD